MNAPITAVTVFEDRASITRRGVVALGAGQQRITIEGVSPVISDKTLSAIAEGARVLDVRCERYLADWRDPERAPADSPLAELHAERTRLQGVRDAALARASAARAEIESLHEVMNAAYRELAVQASRGIAPDGAGAQLAELDAMEAAARRRALDAEAEAEHTEAVLARLAERIERAEDEAGHEAARLVIDLLADAPVDAVLTIRYLVPGAAWRPYHRAELAVAAGHVEWTTTACVWQATGEDWTDVELTCSLERTSLGVEPPSLVDDEVRTQRRSDGVVVDMRDHQRQETGLGKGPLEVPGIDDGGLGLTLRSSRASIRANGEPHRVPVEKLTSPVQLSLVAIPLRSPWVHVRARLLNTSARPLLAGPVDLVRSSGYVGRGEVGFVAPGEKFELGFGPESDVRVHRTETHERDDAGLLGGWNVLTVRVAVRLSNLGAEPREVTVTERVPISEIEQVEVQVAGPDAYRLDASETQVTARTIDEQNFVTWTVALPPFGRRAVTLEYRIRSQRGVTGI